MNFDAHFLQICEFTPSKIFCYNMVLSYLVKIAWLQNWAMGFVQMGSSYRYYIMDELVKNSIDPYLYWTAATVDIHLLIYSYCTSPVYHILCMRYTTH